MDIKKYYLNQLDYKDYHPANFWNIVREAWTKLDIVRDLLGPGYNSNDDLLDLLKGDGLKLLYNGYSWSLFGDKCTLYQATLKGPGAGQPLTNLCLTNPRRMSVEDLTNAQVVSRYANEDFVSWPWLYYDFDKTHQAEVAAYNQNLENALDKGYHDINEQYYFADADNTPLYTYVVNTIEGNRYYYNSTTHEQSKHRYEDRNMRHEFWIDSVQVDNPFNIETPIQ